MPMPTAPAWSPGVTCCASSPTRVSRGRRIASRSIFEPAAPRPPRDSRLKPALALNRKDTGDSPELREGREFHRPRQYADTRERRGVVKAKGAARGGDLVNTVSRILCDRDRDINSVHCMAPATRCADVPRRVRSLSFIIAVLTLG